ncbi:hypothetical protein LENED_003853 [Lentinula edodes]|uniref:Uncharacterized protein n=1 Tax=Lentinula edodes TaxID=5353 RepID=A0A1Q3E4P8_LENED|nr:hypothetical protein LENED_003853 [Lentinula edodes]
MGGSCVAFIILNVSSRIVSPVIRSSTTSTIISLNSTLLLPPPTTSLTTAILLLNANSINIHPLNAYDILSFQKDKYPCEAAADDESGGKSRTSQAILEPPAKAEPACVRELFVTPFEEEERERGVLRRKLAEAGSIKHLGPCISDRCNLLGENDTYQSRHVYPELCSKIQVPSNSTRFPSLVYYTKYLQNRRRLSHSFNPSMFSKANKDSLRRPATEKHFRRA